MKVTHKNSEIEGTPQEIHDLFQNNGMDLNAFLLHQNLFIVVGL